MLSTPLSLASFASFAICFNIFIGFKWKFMCTKICGSNLRSMSSEKVIHTQLLFVDVQITLTDFFFVFLIPFYFLTSHPRASSSPPSSSSALWPPKWIESIRLQAKHAASWPFPFSSHTLKNFNVSIFGVSHRYSWRGKEIKLWVSSSVFIERNKATDRSFLSQSTDE